jgi:polysaccharide biosynthesis transport protein
MASSGMRVKPFDVPRFLLRRGPLIAFGGVALFLVLAPLLLTRVSPSYRAETHLMMNLAKQPTLQGYERSVIPGDMRDYMRTLTVRIRSYNVLWNALENLPREEWPVFLDPDASMMRNVFRLMGRLAAYEIPGTYLLEVSIQAGHPRGLSALIDTVTETFLATIEKEQEQQYARRLAYLTEERERITERIEGHRAVLVGLADRAGQRAFLHKAYEAHLSKLQILQEFSWKAEVDRVEAESELQRVRRRNEDLRDLSLRPFADGKVMDNYGVNQMEQWTYAQLQELRSSIDGLTPSNPERQYVETRMDAMQDYLRDYRSDVSSSTADMLRDERDHTLASDLIEAEAAAEAARSAADILREERHRAAEEASMISDVIFTAQETIFIIEQLQTRLAAIDSRIDDNQIQAKAPLPVHVERRAISPEAPFDSNRKKLLSVAFILAFGMIGAICFLFDFLDNRVRGRGEVERVLGGPIPDPIPSVERPDPAHETLDSLVLVDPDHGASRAFRKLAVRLAREKAPGQARVVCLSGTETGAGNSTVAANLAACLAAAGDRVVVLETAIDQPAACWGGGVGGASPRARVEPGGDALSIASRDAMRSIDVVSAAHWGGGALRGAELAAALERARSSYDWVLLDAAPLADSDLSQFALQHTDVLILTVREDASYYGRLCEARDLAAVYRVPVMTAVLNGARPQPGSWLFVTIQSALNLLSWMHRKAQNAQRALLRERKP